MAPSESSPTRWGEQTRRALENFQISGEPMPSRVIRALALIKGEAAAINGEFGVITAEISAAVRRACGEIVDGSMADQFPVDVFQTGSGTSTNMNMNEVVAHRAGEILGGSVHPIDHVNRSQSSNDAIPSAIRIAAAQSIVAEMIPALQAVAAELRALSARHRRTVKAGRTHLMDAVPMTFGQEVGGWARGVELAVERVTGVLPRLCELPLGGTAVGTGLNAPAGFGRLAAARLTQVTGIDFREAVDHFEAQGAQDALVETSGAVRSVALTLHKIAGDLRLLGSGPRTGIAEIRLRELQAGSSIMPGKVNPVVPEVVQQVAAQVVGNDAAIAFASTASMLQLNTAMPVMARNLIASIELVATASAAFAACIHDIEVDHDRMATFAADSPAVVTALAPLIGYDAAAALVKRAQREGVTVQSLLTSATVEAGPEVMAAIDPLFMATGSEEPENDHAER
jgi:fumarate hydratase, class II